MNKEELLNPRYKVIADYPDSNYLVGTFVEVTDRPYLGRPESFYQLYPHLFKKLEWWEERKPEEMPEYVSYISLTKSERVFTKYRGVSYLKAFYGPHVLPATKEEYEKFNSDKEAQECDATEAE